jgi:hypothetical protein
MRKKLLVTMALGAFIALTVVGIATAAGGEKPVVVQAGNLKLTFNGGVTPKALPKNTFAPISLNVSGKIQTTDGSQPPALHEVIIDTDKDGMISTKGYPTCTSGQLQARDTAAVEKACGPAIIGKGETTVSIAFPEQAPIPAKSPLLVFNGGEKGGVTTLYVHAYLTQPITTAIVTTVKITKEHKGPFGTHSVASIPVIAGGSGSVTAFALTINKKFTYKGKKVSVLTAKCADGKFQAHAVAVFTGGPKVEAEVIRTCTAKG